MADDYGVSVLVNMIFDEKYFNSEEMLIRKSTIPTSLFNKDFYERMRRVMFIRNQITSCKWQNFFDTYFKHMLSSHEMYITFIIFACFSENECQESKFESFLSACSLVKFLSDETLLKSGVNFCDFNPDIFMVFYDHQLKKVCNSCGGFQSLVKYIRDHKYLTMIGNWGDLVLAIDPTIDYHILPSCLTQRDFYKQFEKELRRGSIIWEKTNPDGVAIDATSINLAKEVLSFTQSVPPSLPSHLDIIKSVTEYRIKKMAKCSEADRRVAVKSEFMDEDLNGLCSNSDSKLDRVEKREDKIEQHENIIKAVNKYNNTKSFSSKNTRSRIQEEAGVLEHLKDMIKSLSEISVFIKKNELS